MTRLLFLFFLLVMSAVTPSIAATCSGGANCTACTSCSGCRNCSKAGGTCSVCRPDLYRASAAQPVAPQRSTRRTFRQNAPAPYFNNPTASEPSWVRQQRLERSQGIGAAPFANCGHRCTACRFHRKVCGRYRWRHCQSDAWRARRDHSPRSH